MRALLLGAAALLALAAPAGATDLRSQTKSYPIEGVHRVRLRLAPGQVTVAGTDGDHVRIAITVRCDAVHGETCEERAKSIELDATRNGDELRLEVSDNSFWHRSNSVLEVEVQVPRGLAVTLHLGAGQLEATDLSGDLNVEMGAGQASLFLREGDVRSVHARVGVGDATLRVHDRTIGGDGWIGRRLRWSQGRGASDVDVSMGAGEVDLRLDGDQQRSRE